MALAMLPPPTKASTGAADASEGPVGVLVEGFEFIIAAV
jgi:hypothetical protein